MTDMDAPNQETVRGDASGPGLPEGGGGSPPIEDGTGGAPAPEPSEPAPLDDGLDAMTKDELLAEAEAAGVQADSSMTKAEIVAAIRGGS